MNSLNRYTNLAATIHLLYTKKITLLDPSTWDDKNDAFFLDQYKIFKKASAVLALCFTQGAERYHYWRTFSNGTDGVCVHFDKDSLLSAFQDGDRIRSKQVRYEQVKDIGALQLNIDELPFVKRWPYRDEKEFRILYLDKKSRVESREYNIDMGCIRKITLSPWMPVMLKESVRRTLHAIDGCSKLQMSQSTLIENETWKKVAGRLLKSGPGGRVRARRR